MSKTEEKKNSPLIKKLEVGPLLTNCYLLQSEGEIAIIDPGGDADIILQSVDTLEGLSLIHI